MTQQSNGVDWHDQAWIVVALLCVTLSIALTFPTLCCNGLPCIVLAFISLACNVRPCIVCIELHFYVSILHYIALPCITQPLHCIVSHRSHCIILHCFPSPCIGLVLPASPGFEFSALLWCIASSLYPMLRVLFPILRRANIYLRQCIYIWEKIYIRKSTWEHTYIWDSDMQGFR